MGHFVRTTGSMSAPYFSRTSHTATLLANGKVLIAGGGDGNDAFASAELYDPAEGKFRATGNLAAGVRYAHTATLLINGKVLIAGGEAYPIVLDSAELYDPAAGIFSANDKVWFRRPRPLFGPTSISLYHFGDVMTAPRELHTATLLPNGKVLIAGGANFSSGPLATAELYDPAFGTFCATTYSMATARYWHTATSLAGGKVLIRGGEALVPGILASAELYDPAAGTFIPTGYRPLPPNTNANRFHTATLLADGKVLIAGGVSSADGVSFKSSILATAELYDPAAQTFSATTHNIP